MDGGVDGDGLPPTFDLETRGGEFMAWIPTVTWDSVKAKLQSIFAVFALKGITNISIIGFCWGAWVAMRAAADFEGIFKAACCAHPAIHLEQYAYGGDLVALGSKVTIPVLLLPAGNDPEIYSEEGAFTVELKKNNAKSATTSEYKDMKHGFLPRGDLSDTAVASKVTQALNEMCEFICANN